MPQLAALGVETAQARHGASEAFTEVTELLREAEQAVERAHAIVAALIR